MHDEFQRTLRQAQDSGMSRFRDPPDTSKCSLDKAIEFLQPYNEKLKGIAKRSYRVHTLAKHPAGENHPHL
jgi:hypothetical protein